MTTTIRQGEHNLEVHYRGTTIDHIRAHNYEREPGDTHTPATSVRMFFNGILCEFTAAESHTYFGFSKAEYNYQLWDTYSVISADGKGMSEVLRVNQEELKIVTDFGTFIIRRMKDGDKKVYGVNNFKGVFVETTN